MRGYPDRQPYGRPPHLIQEDVKVWVTINDKEDLVFSKQETIQSVFQTGNPLWLLAPNRAKHW